MAAILEEVRLFWKVDQMSALSIIGTSFSNKDDGSFWTLGLAGWVPFFFPFLILCRLLGRHLHFEAWVGRKGHHPQESHLASQRRCREGERVSMMKTRKTCLLE